MNVVRNATPGTRARIRSSSRSYFWRVPGRFIRASTGFDACCSGRSMYLQTLLALGHGRERLVVDGRRIQVEQANPLESVDRVQRAQQPSQRAALLTVDAVKRRVLRDEQQFLDAPRRQ